MTSFSRKHWPLFAVAALMVAGLALAHGHYIDPTYLTAAPLLVPLGLITDPNAKTVRDFLAKRDELLKASQSITELAAKAGTDLTAEQKATIDQNLAAIAQIDADVKRLNALIEAERTAPVAGTIIETKPRVEDDPKRGFKSLGDFAMAVVGASLRPQGMDERLRVVAATPGATYSNESSGADGGFLIPTEFSREITRLSLDSDSFLPRTDAIPVSGNAMTFPSDETTPWGTNGVRVYWASEAQAATATKPVIKPNTMRLNKLFGLVPVSDEMLADGPTIGAYLQGLLARSIKWKVNDALVNGDGAGQPLGILNGGGLVVIAKEGGQAANTVLPQNVAKMLAAMPADYQAGAEWIIAPDAFPAIITLTLGNYPLFMPPTAGIQGAPNGFLLGKPITLSQTAAAFSSQGDLILTNFKAYRTISKDGVQVAESMHLYFDADATAFRATFRLDGQPTFKQTIAQARGAQALSPYVTLAAR